MTDKVEFTPVTAADVADLPIGTRVRLQGRPAGLRTWLNDPDGDTPVQDITTVLWTSVTDDSGVAWVIASSDVVDPHPGALTGADEPRWAVPLIEVDGRVRTHAEPGTAGVCVQATAVRFPAVSG